MRPNSGVMFEMVARSPMVRLRHPRRRTRGRPTTPLVAQELGQRQHDVGRGDARLPLAGQLDADDLRQAHHRRAAEHHVSASRPTDADRDHAQRIDVRVWLSVPTQVSGNATPSRAWITGDIFSRLIWCMMPLPGRDHVDVLERGLGPLDEVEAVFVAPVLDRAVLANASGSNRRIRPPASGRRSTASAPPG